MNLYPHHANPDDRKACAALVDKILADGNCISVFDGEQYPVKRSYNKLDILKAMASTGEDLLVVRNEEGLKLGTFFLIYDNGSEGEPMIVIADHTANEYCESVWTFVDNKMEAYTK